jgi:hypothetical protein
MPSLRLQVHAARPGASVAFHTAFGLAYVGACGASLRAFARRLATGCLLRAPSNTPPILLKRLAAYLYGGKVVLLLALSTTSYALSKLLAGTRAGCVR